VWRSSKRYDPADKIYRADPHITIKISSSAEYDFTPRRSFSVSYANGKIKKWKWLLENQKYACIGDAYAGVYKKIMNGRKITEQGWIFENLKTNKGCDSYFSGWCI